MVDSNEMTQTRLDTNNKTNVPQEVRLIIRFSKHLFHNEAVQLTRNYLQSNHNLNQPQKQFLLNALQNHVIQWYVICSIFFYCFACFSNSNITLTLIIAAGSQQHT